MILVSGSYCDYISVGKSSHFRGELILEAFFLLNTNENALSYEKIKKVISIIQPTMSTSK